MGFWGGASKYIYIMVLLCHCSRYRFHPLYDQKFENHRTISIQAQTPHDIACVPWEGYVSSQECNLFWFILSIHMKILSKHISTSVQTWRRVQKKAIVHGMIYTCSWYFLWTIVGKIGSRVEKILCPSLCTQWILFVLPSLLFVWHILLSVSLLECVLVSF